MPHPETGSCFITNRFGEAIIPAVNRGTFDRIGAAAVFERQFGDLFKQADTLYIVVGSDSGLLPRWVADQGPGEGSRYLFIEPQSVLPLVAENCAESFAHHGFHLSAPEEWDDMAESLQLSDYAYLGRVALVLSVGATDGFLSDYRAIEHFLREALEKVRRQVGLQLGNFVFLRRQIENIGDNLFPAHCLTGRFTEWDAVLLAGGPSLDEIIPWVKQHREHLIVLAVSRIARQLQAQELVPDIVFSIDPHPVSFDVSKEGLAFPPETVLVCGNHVVPTLQAQWPGPVLYCGERFPWPADPEPENLPMPGPTVTNLALGTAVEMGFQRIILGGVDLCYDRSGYTHASGSNEHQAGANLAPGAVRIPTNGGWVADTNAAFAQGAQTLSQQASHALQHHVQIINPAPGAAKIDNVLHLPLEQLHPTSPARPADALLRDCLSAYDTNYQASRLHEGLDELTRIRGQLGQVTRLCEEARECNRRLHADKAGHDLRFKKRMDKIERKLDRRFGELTRLVKSFAIAPLLRLGRPDCHGEWSAAELARWGDDYYRIYGEACQAMVELVDASCRSVRSRLEELADQPDIDSLLEQWERDNTPGRARCFRRHRPEIANTLTPAQSQRLADMETALQRIIADQDTQQARQIRQQYDIGLARPRLQRAFERQDTSELAAVVEALAGIDTPVARELHSLGLGYQAELQGMNSNALSHYQQVVDQANAALESDNEAGYNPRLEDALRRMSHILLQEGDGETALLVLDALSNLSPAYQPQFAELLRLNGRIQEAADVYTDYLKRAPDDLATLLKLGKLFQEAGAIDSARWAYEYVLQQSPGNQAAQTLRDSLALGTVTP